MKRPLIDKANRESGQATLLVIVAMSIFLLGAVGLAIDGSHLYAQRQMAQAAADAAAQAGILTIFNGGTGMGTHTAGTAFTCAANDAATPCQYAQSLNGFNAALDTVSVDFPDAATVGISASSLSTSDPVNIMRVTVQRQVATTLIRFLGPSTETIKARGTAAIVETPSAIPIIVTHPGLPSKGGALSFNGTPDIKIIGGPPKSIQVNSSDDGAIDTTSCSNATVDLSKAGPDGKGADFGNHGGPSDPCFTFIPGIGSYVRASIVEDPLAGVPVPSSTGMNINPPPDPTIPVGTNGCVQVSGGPATCTLYKPGLYNTADGITIKDSKTNGLALFAPGMYYISQGGFNMQSNSAAAMATGALAVVDPLFPEIGTAGMVVFNSGTGKNDIFSFSSNAGALSPGIQLHGAPEDSKWDGILFYEDPDPATGGSHTGLPSGNPGHQIWGAGSLSLTGTIYINSRSGVTPSEYQALTLGGGGGSNTTVTGEIIVNTLSLGGNGQINMNLSSVTRLVRQVALVQ